MDNFSRIGRRKIKTPIDEFDFEVRNDDRGDQCDEAKKIHFMDSSSPIVVSEITTEIYDTDKITLDRFVGA